MLLPQEPNILASYLNLKLRDEYENLDALCEDVGIDKEKLVMKLKSAGFHYDEKISQFK